VAAGAGAAAGPLTGAVEAGIFGVMLF
jgi:hypothetical protein